MSHATLEKHFSGSSSPVEADGDFVFPLYVEHALRDWCLRRTYLSAQMETCKKSKSFFNVDSSSLVTLVQYIQYESPGVFATTYQFRRGSQTRPESKSLLLQHRAIVNRTQSRRSGQGWSDPSRGGGVEWTTWTAHEFSVCLKGLPHKATLSLVS